ncbi:MAG: metalloregulator ArsR/SmtB family transcription factor [Candidatus Kapabacteria bacterium]|nr:metalloregulator ArsR/SmtB family transcription factor [Candidatus Kapabacteria bacterium]
MSTSKAENFSQELQDLARINKALSHPARLAIIIYLAEKNICFSGNIALELPLSRTTVTQHLNELKEAGIIKGEINGKNVCYCINNDALLNIKKLIDKFLNKSIDLAACNC